MRGPGSLDTSTEKVSVVPTLKEPAGIRICPEFWVMIPSLSSKHGEGTQYHSKRNGISVEAGSIDVDASSSRSRLSECDLTM